MARHFVCSSTEPIVQTKAGKIRGFILDGTYTFHGIKYADAKRFQMPTEVEPWDGVRDALSYGYVCPMLDPETAVGEIMVPHRYWPKSENCQYLNVWTQSVDPNAKKPVMVWLHGGGFAAGSSIEQQAYDGENLSKFGDVVVVTINHRLNILGYMDLSPFGEKYANSGNAGNADMVAALQWVHDNIANFGGDPGNVTIFGQSGGGAKVQNLMQIPSANGLFHKGIIQSGVADFPDHVKIHDSKPIVNAMLKELGFDEGDVEKLETVPYEQMAAAYKKVAPALMKQGYYVGGNPIANEFYVGDPRKVGFTDHAKTIPVMVGSVIAEMAFAPGIKNKHALSEEEIRPMIEQKYKDASDELISLFKQAYPNKSIADLLYLDSMVRIPSTDFALKKAVHPEAPTYLFQFAYEFPYDDGKPAWHCSEIPFVFHNTDKIPICNIPGVSDRLEEQMCGAWVSFARSGNPNHPGLPEWPACKPGDAATMIFDTTCEAKHNYDNSLMELHKKASPAFGFRRSSDDEIVLH